MSLDQDVRALAQLSLFSHLEPEALRLIAFTGEKINLEADEVLFRRGETADCGFIVLSGKLAMANEAGSEGEEVHAVPISLVGGTAMIAEVTRPSTARAAVASQLLKIPRHLFLRVMKEFPLGAERLRAHIADRLEHFTHELDVVRQRAEARAAEFEI